jgi:hypothetical protein
MTELLDDVAIDSDMTGQRNKLPMVLTLPQIDYFRCSSLKMPEGSVQLH